MSTGIIYQITHKASGKAYVGQTRNALEGRWRQHCRQARGRQECQRLHRAIAKHGPEAFTIEPLLIDVPEDWLNDLETLAIQTLETLAPRGYNLKTSGTGGRPSPETLAKMRDSQRGRVFSDQHRAAIAAALRSKPPRRMSAETRAKMSAAKKGRPLSAEHRAAISATRQGHPVSEETREKLRAAWRRRKGQGVEIG